MSTLLPIAFATLLAAGTAVAADDPLASHCWRDRLLVVAASDARDPLLAEQKRLYRAVLSGMKERDLVLVEAVGPGGKAVALRRRFGIAEGAFAAVLVGKDGGAKLRSDRPIPSARLFETVDEMPMRRDEMRRRPSG